MALRREPGLISNEARALGVTARAIAAEDDNPLSRGETLLLLAALCSLAASILSFPFLF